MITDREGIAVAELVLYIPLLLASIYVNVHQGWSYRMGWYFILIFCIIRIAGAAFEVVSAQNPTVVSDAIGAAILSSIGLSPLLLACFGLLRRVTDGWAPHSWRVRALNILHLPCLVGLILGIVGGSEISSAGVQSSSGAKFSQAAAILFLIAFIGLIVLCAGSAVHFRLLASAEARILTVLLVALPLLAVRVLYILLIDFANSKTFSVTSTSNASAFAQLGMSIIEELIVVVMFVVIGIVTPGKAKSASGGQMPLAGKRATEGHYVQQNV